MITYVNTVLVSNLTSSNVIATKAAYDALSASDAGKFVVITLDENAASGDTNYPVVTSSTADKYERIKVGLVTSKTAPSVNYTTGAVTNVPVIKWSNVISADSIKSVSVKTYNANAESEDKVVIDFNDLNANLLSKFAESGKRIIVRLTFKDLPTRFRKWTESYEYVTKAGDTKATIATNIANMINKEYKRARVVAAVGNATYDKDTEAFSSFTANASGTAIQLTAMPYDDDNSVDSINWHNKVRFNANIYYTDPAAEGWESINKHFPTGTKVNKVPGLDYIATGKLVRDRESQAMGYEGILNRGEGTWPIIKPEMQTDITKNYDAITLEFERMYRSADDLHRKTKECVEIYVAAGGSSAIAAILNAFK